MTVLPFPARESRAQRILGIEACLQYLQAEAKALNLPILAHVIGVAREEARDATEDERP